MLDATHINALRKLLGNILTDSQLARTESHWHKFGSPTDAIDRIAVVMADSEAWRTLLVEPEGREVDADHSTPT